METPDLTRCAVIVVDVQNDFCLPEGIHGAMGFSVAGRTEVATRIRDFTDAVRELGRPIIFARNETPTWGRSAALTRQFGRSPLHRVPADYLTDWFVVQPDPDDIVITKSRYSAFHATGLDAALRALDIDTVMVCGFTTEVCVDTTVRDAFLRDYHVLCLRDCTEASTPERHEVTLGILDTFFGVVTDSEQVLAALREQVREQGQHEH